MVFKQNNIWNNLNGTRDPSSPTPLMAKVMKNDHFFIPPLKLLCIFFYLGTENVEEQLKNTLYQKIASSPSKFYDQNRNLQASWDKSM